MKAILTGTVAAFVLGAAIASSQTPPAGGQTQQGQPMRQQGTPAKGQTYRGYLRGSPATGYTIQPMESRAGATGTAGATPTPEAQRTTYTVVAGEGARVNLASMADQCVEVIGVVAPAMGAPAGAAGGRAGQRTLTITTIKKAEGCKP